MIYTNEPANALYVLVSAFRSNFDYEVNMSRHRHMVSTLRAAPGLYGVIESTDLTGYYREDIANEPTEEKTIRVRCKDKGQVLQVARLACNEWEQDCVLVYKSHTHTVGLVYAKGIDGYKAERLPGSFQEVPQGAPLQGCYTIDEYGRRWQVQ